MKTHFNCRKDLNFCDQNVQSLRKNCHPHLFQFYYHLKDLFSFNAMNQNPDFRRRSRIKW